jgi:CTP-dependent riboflavin kinase
VGVGNNKIYQSFDSINYTIYDSLETIYYKGGYNFNVDKFIEYKPYNRIQTPYIIDIKLNRTDTVYGDFELFCTDITKKPVMIKIKKIKLKYDKRRQTLFMINS